MLSLPSNRNHKTSLGFPVGLPLQLHSCLVWFALGKLYSILSRMLFIIMAFSLSLPVLGQQGGDEWLDPYDMINYDASTKTMRKSTQPAKYDNVATRRREYTQDSEQTEVLSCNRQVAELQRQVDELKKNTPHFSQQSTCNPVFKRFLNRLLKEIGRVGAPSDSTDVFYDAKIKLSKQAITEIQALLEGEDRWRTGALDNAISQILVDLKPHDYIAWKWRFEDTFGVELDTVIKMGMAVLIMVAIMCTQMWSTVSWFVQFSRLFAVCFFLSIIWNWFYLYKIAFAEHQSKIVKMDSFNEKCTGVKKIDWSDSLKELFRSTLTLQDDPCKMYYEVLYINPILLVPPTKAMSVTITTFITEPMKHFGQGISEFLRALLKDLPITLQIPVLLTIIFSIVVCMYGGVQSAFQYGIMAPLRRPRRDPPPPELDQPRPRPLRNESQNEFSRGDVPPQADEPLVPLQHAAGYGAADARSQRNEVHQRRPNKVQPNVPVKTLRPVDPLYSEDEMDAARHEESQDQNQDQDINGASDEENQQETPEALKGPTDGKAAESTNQTKTKPAESDSSRSRKKTLKENEKLSKDQHRKDSTVARSQAAEKQLPHVDIQDPEAKMSPISVPPVETVGLSAQEMSSA